MCQSSPLKVGQYICQADKNLLSQFTEEVREKPKIWPRGEQHVCARCFYVPFSSHIGAWNHLNVGFVASPVRPLILQTGVAESNQFKHWGTGQRFPVSPVGLTRQSHIWSRRQKHPIIFEMNPSLNMNCRVFLYVHAYITTSNTVKHIEMKQCYIYL